MNHTEQTLEFDKIKQIWRSFAVTEAVQEQIPMIVPCLEEQRLLCWQRDTTEARQLIELFGAPPLPTFSGMRDILAIAKTEGCLTEEQLEGVARNLSSIRRLKQYLVAGKEKNIFLACYEENLNSCDTIRETILRQIRNGRVDDYATNRLRDIRRELEAEQTKMQEKANQMMRSNKELMADSFTTLRNGHICLPVKKEYRHKIAGSVLDKSSSGSTVFIEPASVYKHYEAISLLHIDEENEEMRIRYTLTAMILEEWDTFDRNMATVETLDFAFSKGKFSLEYGGIAPQINTDRRIHLEKARHPLMAKSLCVPLDFDIGGEVRGVVITGPNTGGKTVAIKTVALCCMMAQCGLHVPCEKADLCMNSNYLWDIGDGQNLSENLSTFSAHLTNILHILSSVNEESLVVLDELGSGTDPTEGMGIAIAVLEELTRSHALFLVTTHYPEVKHYADETPCIQNARMDFDRESLRPLYRLIMGEAGESCAFSIAKRLGMSDKMLRRAAEAAYGAERAVPLPGSVNDYDEEETAAKNRQISTPGIIKKKAPSSAGRQERARAFQLGDSVLVYPDKKIGIVCQTANEKGILRVQLPDRKIWINHKRLKLHVAAAKLYPEDYDFSILFDSVEERKLRHKMERKYVEEALIREESE